VVELRKIGKFFPSNGVRALDGADFTLREGEIHALLGENGAGKSTLMHIMAGFMKSGGTGSGAELRLAPGHIVVDGREQRFSSPAGALSAGIGMVRQHPHQIPGFTVWENCSVGTQDHPPLWMDRRAYRNKIGELNERFHFDLPLDLPSENLSVSQGQKAAILTLLLRKVRYLIFDEPTAVLSPAETEQLFSIFRQLRDEGRGIVLISHKLDETLRLVDRVTVLRRGRTRLCCHASGLDSEALWEAIFGAESSQPPLTVPSLGTLAKMSSRPAFGSRPAESLEEDSLLFSGPPALALRDFTVNVPGHPLIRGLNLTVERGRITGIAGVRDSGLETLERAVTGFLPSSGSLEINGIPLEGKNRIRSFRTAGAAYLDTRNEGIDLSVQDMLIIHAHRRYQRRGILDKPQIRRWVSSVIAMAKVPFRDQATGAVFSGGQLQRLLLTREMAENTPLLVLSSPGRGLDRRYRKKLGLILREKASFGTGILIFSSDVEELLLLANHVMVLRNGVFSASTAVTGPEVPPSLHNTIREAMV
jgi:simple sugar transport system ATP-binding protein